MTKKPATNVDALPIELAAAMGGRSSLFDVKQKLRREPRNEDPSVEEKRVAQRSVVEIRQKIDGRKEKRDD